MSFSLPPAVGAAVVGGVWSWVALAVSSILLPRYLALGERMTESVWYTTVTASALLPVTVARTVVVGGVGVADGQLGGITPLMGALSAAVGCVFGIAAVSFATRSRLTRRLATATGAVLTLVALVSSIGLSVQLHDLTVAEHDFVGASGFSCGNPTRPCATAVADARRFAWRHRDSRWASEALRVLALDATAQGRYHEAAEIWMRFAASFAEPGLPGVAYGDFSAAMCEERLGDVISARRLYAASVTVIRRRGGDLQGWIAASAAKRIAGIDASRAMTASSRYWLAKAEAFDELYGSNE